MSAVWDAIFFQTVLESHCFKMTGMEAMLLSSFSHPDTGIRAVTLAFCIVSVGMCSCRNVVRPLSCSLCLCLCPIPCYALRAHFWTFEVAASLSSSVIFT